MITATSTSSATYTDQGRTAQAAVMRSEPSKPVTSAVGMNGADASQVQDRVTLSPDGQARSRQGNPAGKRGTDAETSQSRTEGKPSSPGQLTPDEQQTVQKLKQRDTEVKQHEAAHLAAAGQYAAGGPSYTYQNGPDGKRYAIGGEVPIDVSTEKTPEQTIQKMRIVRQAALAPANPSGADQSIAATASMKEAEARRELNIEEAGQARQTGPQQASGTEQDTAGNNTVDQAAMQSNAVRRTPLSTYA